MQMRGKVEAIMMRVLRRTFTKALPYEGVVELQSAGTGLLQCGGQLSVKRIACLRKKRRFGDRRFPSVALQRVGEICEIARQIARPFMFSCDAQPGGVKRVPRQEQLLLKVLAPAGLNEL